MMRIADARQLVESERARLLQARDALRRLAGPDNGSQREDTGELSGMDEHVADIATETFEREVEIGLLHTVEAELAEVEAAIARLDEGTYGRCRWCGAVIPDDRLRAVPATTLCLDHQERVEVAAAVLLRDLLHNGIEREAASHIDLLPSDEPRSVQSPEEGALHVIVP
jgi:RNA polymerase-binding transcription factor DksA